MMHDSFIKTPSGAFVSTDTITLITIEEVNPSSFAIVVYSSVAEPFFYSHEESRADAEIMAQSLLESNGFRVLNCIG